MEKVRFGGRGGELGINCGGSDFDASRWPLGLYH